MSSNFSVVSAGIRSLKQLARKKSSAIIAVAKGISVPIIAGIMPILSVFQIKRFTQICGASIPQPLLDKIEAVEDDPEAVRHLGTYHATDQCQDLLDHGVAGIHFYTLNRSTATRAIYQQIKARVAAINAPAEA